MSEPCGPGADDRYCAIFWDKHAEIEQLRAELATVRARVAQVADHLEQSAAATHPSRKSQIERDAAKAVREAIGDGT